MLSSTAQNNLSSAAYRASPLMLALYNKPDPSDILPALAHVVKPGFLQSEYTLEWWDAWGEIYEWVGERVVQETFSEAIKFKPQAYEGTWSIDRLKIKLDNARSMVKRPSDLARHVAQSFRNGRVKLAYQVLAENWLSYDGQSLFDEEHEHPGDGGQYSNMFDSGRADEAAPTVQEVRAELKRAIDLLHQNRLVRHSLVRASGDVADITVITRSHGVWSAFSDLRNERKIGGDDNRFRGKFEILRDYAPPAAEANSVDFIMTESGGPRPVIFGDIEAPSAITVDAGSNFTDRRIKFGSDNVMAIQTGFPQTACRRKAA